MISGMFARLRLVLLAFVTAMFVAASHADIVNGSTRGVVIAELGKPTSVARRGTHEILLYPKGVRIELVGDAVVDIKGYVPSAHPAGAAAKAPPAPKPSENPLKSLEAPPEEEFNPAIAANALGDEVAKINTAWGSVPPPAEQPSPEWLETVLGVLLHFGLTVFALRIAFKYWEMDAFWTGTLAIAAIDAALHGLLGALGPVTGGLTTMSGVQNSLPGVVMIFTVRHYCFNKNLQNAVLTAGCVKVVVMICGLLLYSIFLSATHG
jgi:hypothetical protein